MAKMCLHDALIDEFYSIKCLSSTCTCNKNSTLKYHISILEQLISLGLLLKNAF